ncbi:MAG TPA: sigma-70 family RNA polymerase sigma factor [Tepidisphaeraceae bacterium]|nr:sigma-70 family RNA polymerase sigma factor [Tepidisphaeraceae bacterium]
MLDDERLGRFKRVVMPHLDAAYNLARWLTRNEQDADDVVQEATLRALRGLDGLRGDDARCWLLTIVRNTCFTWLRRNRPGETQPSPQDDSPGVPVDMLEPGEILEQATRARGVREAIGALPAHYREIVILREMEGMSYKEIAQVTGLPPGTVMSRLARARERLHESLAPLAAEET